jgi:hypothetical protein
VLLCPNCNAEATADQMICAQCNADFGPHSAWKPVDPSRPSEYVPNQVPLSDRVWAAVFSAALVAYCIFGIAAGQMYVPGRGGNGVSVRGASAYLLCAAMVCGVLNLAALVADHYDNRDNEARYRDFRTWAMLVGWVLFIFAVFSGGRPR